VLPHVGKATTLRLSPDAHLWLAPWAALPLPDDGPYALERFAISYVVTGRDLLRPRGAVETGPPLVLGDVDYDLGVTDAARRVPHPVKPLPASAAEVRSVTPLLEKLTKRKPMSFIGAAAREERVKAAHRPQVLFLSTHGGFGSVEETILRPGQSALLLENPMLRCTLSFAGCNLKETGGEDGHLYGFEIEALDLAGTELVVLSACQTAIGDVHAGQSAASLRQAFQIAGARNVIATLWSAEDRAATRLTVELLEGLVAGRPAAVALRNAQLALLRAPETAHPFYWGPFTLTE
jgi:CHAT domain-containing protein